MARQTSVTRTPNLNVVDKKLFCTLVRLEGSVSVPKCSERGRYAQTETHVGIHVHVCRKGIHESCKGSIYLGEVYYERSQFLLKNTGIGSPRGPTPRQQDSHTRVSVHTHTCMGFVWWVRVCGW